MEGRRLKRIVLMVVILLGVSLLLTCQIMAQDDRMVRVAIDTVKTQLRLPKEIEVRFVEKRESPLPGFYSVKLLLITTDKEIPLMVYVDKTGEKVIIGSLIIKGENVTLKEAGPPIPKKIVEERIIRQIVSDIVEYLCEIPLENTQIGCYPSVVRISD
jgi:hypothetical protein